MRPTVDQINAAAEARWSAGAVALSRTDAIGSTPSWISLFRMNYVQCIHFKLGRPKKQYIGNSKNKRCRFCGLAKPEATFRTTSHAIPN